MSLTCLRLFSVLAMMLATGWQSSQGQAITLPAHHELLQYSFLACDSLKAVESVGLYHKAGSNRHITSNRFLQPDSVMTVGSQAVQDALTSALDFRSQHAYIAHEYKGLNFSAVADTVLTSGSYRFGGAVPTVSGGGFGEPDEESDFPLDPEGGGGGGSLPVYSCANNLGIYNSTSVFSGTKIFNGTASQAIQIFVAGNLTISNLKIILRGGIKPENIIWNVAGKCTIGKGCTVEGIVLAGEIVVENYNHTTRTLSMNSFGKLTIQSTTLLPGQYEGKTICGLDTNNYTMAGRVLTNKPNTNTQQKYVNEADCEDFLNKAPEVGSETPIKVVKVAFHIFQPAAGTPVEFQNYTTADIPFLRAMIEGNLNGQLDETDVPNTMNGGLVSYPAFGGVNDYLGQTMVPVPMPLTTYANGPIRVVDTRVRFKLVGIYFYNSPAANQLANAYGKDVLDYFGDAKDLINAAGNGGNGEVINGYFSETYNPSYIPVCQGSDIGSIDPERYEQIWYAFKGIGNHFRVTGSNWLIKNHVLHGLSPYYHPNCIPKTVGPGENHQVNVTTLGIFHEVGHVLDFEHATDTDGICGLAPYNENILSGARSNNFMNPKIETDYGNFTVITPCQAGRLHYFLENTSRNKFLERDFCVTTSMDGSIPVHTEVARSTTWYAPKMLTGNLIVKAGNSLTIKCRLTFPSTVDGANPKILVEQGAKLIFEGVNIAKADLGLSATVSERRLCTAPVNIEIGLPGDNSIYSGLVQFSGTGNTVASGISLTVKNKASVYVAAGAVVNLLGATNLTVESGGYICYESVATPSPIMNFNGGQLVRNTGSNFGLLNPLISPSPSTGCTADICEVLPISRVILDAVDVSNSQPVPITGGYICLNTTIRLSLSPNNTYNTPITVVWRDGAMQLLGSTPTLDIPYNTGGNHIVFAEITQGTCTKTLAASFIVPSANLSVNGTTTCAGSKFKFTLTRPEYFSSPDETWSLDGGQDITDPALNNCFADCTTSIREVVFSTPGTYTVNVAFVDPSSGCSFSKSQQIMVVPLVNGICCSPIYDRVLGAVGVTTTINGNGNTHVYSGRTKVEGRCEFTNGTFIFPNESIVEYLPISASPGGANHVPGLLARNNGEIKLEGANLKFACHPSGTPVTSPFRVLIAAAIGTGKLNFTKSNDPNPLRNKIDLPGGILNIFDVETSNMIENSDFITKTCLFLDAVSASSATMTVRDNTFDGSFDSDYDINPQYNVVNLDFFASANVSDNQFKNGCGLKSGLGMGTLTVQNNTFDNPRGAAISIGYDHDDVIIKCNAFKFDAANTFAGVGIKLTGKVNSLNWLGTQSDPVGNGFPVANFANVASASYPSDFDTFVSPTNWTSIDNQFAGTMRYYSFVNEFLGNVTGNITLIPVTSASKADQFTCVNNINVNFPLLRRGVIANLDYSPTIADKIVRVYPVPCAEELNVVISSGSFHIGQISNILGVQFISTPLQFQDGISSINVSTLPPGMYILRLTGSSGELTSRFIKR